MLGITEREVDAATAVPVVAGGRAATDETEARADFRFAMAGVLLVMLGGCPGNSSQS